jgi:hypothetical protein
MDDAGYSLVLAFPDESPSFVHGFEAGEIYCLMKQGALEIDRGMAEGLPVHEENAPLYHSMANVQEYTVEVGEPTDGWLPMRFFKMKDQPGRPRLRIVE